MRLRRSHEPTLKSPASTRHAHWLALFGLLTSLALGCADGQGKVGGVVTVDGKPISCGPEMYGTVTFYRRDGEGVPAVAVIDDSGQYALKTGASDSVAPGDYHVAVAVKQITMPTSPDAMPMPRLITPPKYANAKESGFSADVQPGSNTFDFALETADVP